MYLDSAGVATGTGQLRVAVRSVSRPTEGLGEAVVVLINDQQQALKRSVSNPSGLAVFPMVPQGHYRLRVQRLGYEALPIDVSVTAGCAVDVEAYLAMSYIGLEAVVVDTSHGTGKTVGADSSTLRVNGGRATVTLCAQGQ